METNSSDTLFLTLTMMLSQAAWQQLGKVANPATGKIEKDLSHAQMSIDMLRMLKEKTKGNLKPEEDKILSNAVCDLELNYADEVDKVSKEKKPESPATEKTPPDESKTQS
jgi:F0F1-type ATP synthase membrane subunit b/b'